MNQRINNKLILILLLLIFATPTVVGILLYKNPAWLPTKTTNQGQFLTPPVSITVPKSSTPSWSIVLWDRKPCKTACVNQLRALRQLRLALGRQFYNVHITLLLFKSACLAR
ncbi:MAG: hypothetical protein B7X00_01830 [Legionella sp. 21-45-4]|nr:MAG: hypothetical protein B7X00_01830 [Legionella sp. 21-45-4]